MPIYHTDKVGVRLRTLGSQSIVSDTICKQFIAESYYGRGTIAEFRFGPDEIVAVPMAVDEAKLQQLLGKMLGEVGAAMGIGLVLLGDKFGLYKTLEAAGPLTSTELASRTGTAARYVHEWAAAQAAGGYRPLLAVNSTGFSVRQ